MRKNSVIRHLAVGPGGFKCPCCIEAPRSTARHKRFRSAKKKEKHEAYKDAREQMHELNVRLTNNIHP